MNRLGQSFLYTPFASINSLQNGSVMHTKLSRPLRYCFGFSIQSEIGIYALIRHLLLDGRPSTVFGFVVPVVVDSVYGEFFSRTLSHIGQKVREILPSFADFNSATSIVRILMMVWSLTTGLHSAPTVVGSRSGSAMTSCGNPMFKIAPRSFFISCATTRHGNAFYEGLFVNRFGFSAFANTVPIGLAVLSFRLGNNRPATESLTCQVLKICHSTPRMLRTWMSAWQTSVQMLFGSYPSHAKGIIA